MYVHVDFKERRRRIGWAADLCPVCRDLRAFEVNEVRNVARIYLVPIGSGTLESQEIICADCKSVFVAPSTKGAHAGYEGLSKRRREPSRLLEITNPDLLDRVDAWFERQERIARGGLNARERVAEILNVLGSLEHMAWIRSRGGGEELAGLLCLVFFLPVMIATIVIWSSIGLVLQVMLLSLLIALAAIGGVLALTHKSMAASRHLMPRLIRALEPLEPTLDELADALALARRNGLRTGRYLNPQRIERELSRDRRRPIVLAPPEFG